MRKFNVLICGTKYGQAYLSAFISENPDFQLAGILAKGSPRSEQFAREFNVRLYRKVEEVPSDIDIACVAVRATIMGGEGTNSALQLMKHGIHVIQEHPIHPGDVRKCLKQARDSGVCYHVNSHFVNVTPVRIFIDYIQKDIEHEQPLFIEATTSLSYSAIDILGCALGGFRPYGFSQPVKWESSLAELNKNDVLPFQCLQGVIAGIPITLNFQNFYDPKSDIDERLLVMHRICIGMPSGNLTLLNTHGPVVWSTGYFAHKCVEHVISFGNPEGFIAEDLVDTRPTAISFSDNMAPSQSEIAQKHWPGGIRLALSKMREEIITGTTCPGQSAEHILQVSQIWMEITRRFGTPQYISLSRPQDPLPDPVLYRERVISKN